ncbi:MAG: NADH:flavin oxidoreductase [Myxococcota bacterium]|nr:NADH:flavin oxidoreductase [Myxococcota bacterium]
MWRPPEVTKHRVAPDRWPSAEDAAQAQLFSEFSRGRLQLAERTWVPAMVPWRATEDGEVTDNVVQWYGRFAKGQPGAIVVEATGIREIPSGPLLRIGHDRYLHGLKRLVKRVKEESKGRTKLFIQLIDFLRLNRRPKPDVYFGRHLKITPHHRTSIAGFTQTDHWMDAPEDDIRSFLFEQSNDIQATLLTQREFESLNLGYRERVTDTHLAHIASLPVQLPTLFAEAAKRAESAGFDGVELHYAHAYTMASFLSKTNDRNDGYGGPLSHRLRCPLEVYDAVRRNVSDHFIVGCRFLVDEVIEGGFSEQESPQIALAFARGGMDFLSLSKGGKFDDAKQPKVGQAIYPYTGESGYECMPTIYSDTRGPFYRNIQAMAQVKSILREAGLQVPVIVAGGINDFTGAESLLKNGHADIIAAARQSLADPDWFLKIRRGRGDEIRRCKYTNYCEALDTRHKEVTCQLWDRIQIDEPGVALSKDGKRRLIAP